MDLGGKHTVTDNHLGRPHLVLIRYQRIDVTQDFQVLKILS